MCDPQFIVLPGAVPREDLVPCPGKNFFPVKPPGYDVPGYVKSVLGAIEMVQWDKVRRMLLISFPHINILPA